MVEPIDRQPIQDGNAKSILEAGRVSGGGISSPRRADLSGIGQDEQEAAELFQFAGKALQDYTNKNKDKWRVEGMMQRAAGKAEAEVRESGNQYHVEGYTAMEARTSMNEWYQNALTNIDTVDRELTTEQYQAKLSEEFKQVSDGVTNDYARQMLGSMVEQNFPSLVASQVKANASYKQQKTYDGTVSMAASELKRFDPNNPDDLTAIKELVAPGISGLPLELHQKAISEAVSLALDSDTPNMAHKIRAVFGDDLADNAATVANNSGGTANLVDAVRMAESGGKRFAKDGSVLTSPKGAKGEMQVMDSTNLDPGFGVAPAKDNSLAERARVGRDYIVAMWNRYKNPILAAMAYNAGPGAVDAHIKRIGNPAEAGGPNLSEFVKAFPYAETRKYAETIAKNMQGKNAQVASARGKVEDGLLKQGFNAADSTRIMRSLDSYQKRAADKFDSDRIMLERSIERQVETDGNFAAALDQIKEAKERFGYDDSWANGMARSAASAQDKWLKNEEKVSHIRTAAATKSLYTLSGKDLEDGIQMEKTRIVESIRASGQDPAAIPNGSLLPLAETAVMDMLIDNNVVDKKLSASMEANLTGNILNTDGSLKPGVVDSYQKYLYLSKSGPAGYAEKYVGSAKELLAIAESFDGGGTGTEAAIKQAANIQQKREADPNWKPAKPNPVTVEKLVSDTIDKYDSTVFSKLYRYSTDATQVLDSEIAAAKADPRFKGWVEQKVNMYASTGIPVEAALNMTMKDVSSQVEFVMGNVLFSGAQNSIKEDMFGSDYKIEEPTAVNRAFIEFMKVHGDAEEFFGQTFNDSKYQMLGSDPTSTNWFGGNATTDGMGSAMAESYRNLRRSVPHMHVTYDPQLKGFFVDVYTNQERTRTTGAMKFVPAKFIGDWAKGTVMKERSLYDDYVPSMEALASIAM